MFTVIFIAQLVIDLKKDARSVLDYLFLHCILAIAAVVAVGVLIGKLTVALARKPAELIKRIWSRCAAGVGKIWAPNTEPTLADVSAVAVIVAGILIKKFGTGLIRLIKRTWFRCAAGVGKIWSNLSTALFYIIAIAVLVAGILIKEFAIGLILKPAELIKRAWSSLLKT
jgi:hypothetical protein